jgi:nucleoside-diphosphate-sugar epimerase
MQTARTWPRRSSEWLRGEPVEVWGVAAFPWWLLTLASPFVATFREMREMRYLWREPVRMDNTRLIAALGREPHTPLDEALEATLVGLGCLTASTSSEARVLA